MLIQAETGVAFDPWFVGSFDLMVIPLCVLAGLGTGLIPAFQAYRLNVIQALTAHSV
jgi:ABC-type antimicrobial peptide transport system permease subunit